MSFKRFAKNSVKTVLTLAILYFVFRRISEDWSKIETYPWDIHWGYMALCVLVGLITFFILSTMWRKIIFSFGYSLGHAKSFRIFYLSNLGRYVPGKFWQLLGILYLTRKENIPPETATASFVAVQMFVIPSSLLVFAIASVLDPQILTAQIPLLGGVSPYVLLAVMLIISLMIISWPDKVFILGDFILRKLKRDGLSFHMERKVSLTLYLGYCVAWVCYGLGFWLSTKAVSSDISLSPVAAIGAFNAAYQVGYLALFAPGGFGPRELALSVMLQPYVGAIAPVLAVLARLWAIVIEGLAALIALSVRK